MSPPLFLELIARNADTLGDAPALLWDGGALSWRALHKQSDDVAHALTTEGGAPGKRGAIAGLGSAEYVIAFIGILKAGMSVVPLSTMATPDLFRSLLQDSAASFLFADAHSAPKLHKSIPSTCRAIAFDDSPGWTPFGKWRLRTDHAQSIARRPDTDWEFNVIYSSGTTGEPKGIVHDHALRAAQIDALKAFGLGPQSLTILTTALYTNYSLLALLASLGAGGSVFLMPRFREANFLAACQGHPLTHAFLVPAQIERLLDHAGFDAAKRAMTIFTAGSPLSPRRKREVIDRWPGMLAEIYGATEGGASTVLIANQFPDKLASVGKPSAGTDIRIVDDDEHEAPRGTAGEIVGRSALMMRGYLNRAVETEALIWRSPSGEAYLRSGDVGYLDQDGFLYITDRKKDMILSGGMNVFASDLEAVLRQHPAVADCAVVAAPSERWGETPVAFVVLGENSALPTEELRQWANTQLSRHQQIDNIVYRTALPRNEMGKIVKKELRATLASN